MKTLKDYDEWYWETLYKSDRKWQEKSEWERRYEGDAIYENGVYSGCVHKNASRETCKYYDAIPTATMDDIVAAIKDYRQSL